MTAAHTDKNATCSSVLYVAFELGWTEWKLAFTTHPGQKARVKKIAARDLAGLQEQIAKSKKRFGLAADAVVRSCYEAGRDGFWLHRCLLAAGIDNVIVDSASIEVNRRQRRAKSDRLDALKAGGHAVALSWRREEGVAQGREAKLSKEASLVLTAA